MRVSIANDYPVIVSGLAAMLSPFDDRVNVVDWTTVGVDGPHERVDVLLFDTYGRQGVGQDEMQQLVNNELVGSVLLYTWATNEAMIAHASRRVQRDTSARRPTRSCSSRRSSESPAATGPNP